MTWEEKIQAAEALGSELSLRMRKHGDWYVHQTRVERKLGGLLESGCVTGARTPEQAVDQYWNWLAESKPLVIAAYSDKRREVFWNGFMWEEWDKDLIRRI